MRFLTLGEKSQADAAKSKSPSGKFDSWQGICSKSPEHDADHGEAGECGNGRTVAFEVASQATVTTDPRERTFDDPPFTQHLKSSSVRRFASSRQVRHTVIAILRPAYPPSAKMR
jgi:hypothetical protein